MSICKVYVAFPYINISTSIYNNENSNYFVVKPTNLKALEFSYSDAKADLLCIRRTLLFPTK